MALTNPNVQVDVDKAVRQLTRYADGVRRDTNQLIAETTMKVESRAKQNAVVDRGELRSSGSSHMSGGPSNPVGTVEFDADHAPYVEFGTGAFASEYLSGASTEMQQYAMTFYETGDGRMPPKPFLFPAWESVRPEFERELVRLLRNPRTKVVGRAPVPQPQALDLFVFGSLIDVPAIQTALFVT